MLSTVQSGLELSVPSALSAPSALSVPSVPSLAAPGLIAVGDLAPELPGSRAPLRTDRLLRRSPVACPARGCLSVSLSLSLSVCLSLSLSGGSDRLTLVHCSASTAFSRATPVAADVVNGDAASCGSGSCTAPLSVSLCASLCLSVSLCASLCKLCGGGDSEAPATTGVDGSKRTLGVTALRNFSAEPGAPPAPQGLSGLYEDMSGRGESAVGRTFGVQEEGCPATAPRFDLVLRGLGHVCIPSRVNSELSAQICDLVFECTRRRVVPVELSACQADGITESAALLQAQLLLHVRDRLRENHTRIKSTARGQRREGRRRKRRRNGRAMPGGRAGGERDLREGELLESGWQRPHIGDIAQHSAAPARHGRVHWGQRRLHLTTVRGGQSKSVDHSPFKSKAALLERRPRTST